MKKYKRNKKGQFIKGYNNSPNKNRRVQNRCPYCNKLCKPTPPSRIKYGRGIYCSKKCRDIVRFGNCFFKPEKGVHYSPKTEFKKGQYADEKNLKWKGDKVGYSALHTWIHRKLGKAKTKKCLWCNSNKNMRWANISRKYKRDIKDWMPLCSKCHGKYDKGYRGAIKKKYGYTVYKRRKKQ